MQTILVVKYDVSVALLYKDVLEQEGRYRVVIAGSVKVGLRLVKELVPRVVISDMFLPDKTRLVLARSIRESDESTQVAIILLTGKEGLEAELRALGGSYDLCLDKPISLEKLCMSVDNLMGWDSEEELSRDRQ